MKQYEVIYTECTLRRLPDCLLDMPITNLLTVISGLIFFGTIIFMINKLGRY